MNNTNSELAVIIPVYNEEKNIGYVLHDWARELGKLGVRYQIHVYNDGSRDNTLKAINEFASGRLDCVIHDKQNSGQGPTILTGYREFSHVPWIFQVDSDNEIAASEFERFWLKRQDYDFLIGRRLNRKGPLARRFISFLTRITLLIFYHDFSVYDVNCPFRLMRTSVFGQYFSKIPANTFAPNVVLTGLACLKKVRVYQVPVTYSFRQHGEVSIKQWKLMKAALKSFFQVILCRFLFIKD